MVICTAKAEKMREFVEVQSEVQRQKVQLKCEGMQLKEAVSFHWATVFLLCVISLGYCISPLYPKHMVHLLRYGLVPQEWII